MFAATLDLDTFSRGGFALSGSSIVAV